MTDALLRRIERTAAAVCLGMAAAAWPIGGPWAALAVVGGGVLSAFSYATLASATSALTRAVERAARPAPEAPDTAASNGEEPSGQGARTARPGGRSLLKAALRYALLGLLAYVMIARLRLHPVGVLAGVSSVVAAVAIEAVRILVKKS